MEKKIYFDMDGTFYNLYGYEGWLDCILSEHTECYTKSSLLVDYDKFVMVLSELKEKGYPFTCKMFEDMGHGGLIGENTEQFIKEVEKAHTRKSVCISR